jgi:hypothetical protein
MEISSNFFPPQKWQVKIVWHCLPISRRVFELYSVAYSELRNIAGVSMCRVFTVSYWFSKMRKGCLNWGQSADRLWDSKPLWGMKMQETIHSGASAASGAAPDPARYIHDKISSSFLLIRSSAHTCCAFPHIRMRSVQWPIVSAMLVEANNSVLFVNKTMRVSDGIVVQGDWLTSGWTTEDRFPTGTEFLSPSPPRPD